MLFQEYCNSYLKPSINFNNLIMALSVEIDFTFSEQQINAGLEIIKCFQEDYLNFRWAILLAQMQSGKTETYLFICCELIRLSIVDNVVIFSGNAEIDLKEQLKYQIESNESKFWPKYRSYLAEQLSILNFSKLMNTISHLCIQIQPKIKVIWGTELKKYKTSHKNTLFIWEEAHHAQSIHQCPDHFLRKVGISADGDINVLAENGNFVVSISATPFSELSDLHHHNQNKKLVYMRPGAGYNSVKNIVDSGRIKSFTNVESGLRTALSTYRSSPKYAIVRISHKNEERVKHIVLECGWRCVIYDSVSTGEAKRIGDEIWKNMKNAPAEDIVILLRGKCRMGKNLEKEHILFVMETSKRSNTDTILQGLLGRVCGYSKGSDNIDVYLHQKIVNSGEIQRYIDLTDGEQIIPSKACNIVNTTMVKTLHPIIPFIVNDVGIYDSTTGGSRKHIIDRVRKQIEHPNFDCGLTYHDQFEEIREKLFDRKSEIEVHDVSGNEKKRFEPVSKAYRDFRSRTSGNLEPKYLWQTGIEKTKRDGTVLEEGRIIHIFYSKDGDDENNIPEGSALIYGVTKTKNPVYLENTNVPKTTRREVFAHSLEDGTEIVSNGGFIIEMPLETKHNIEAMKSSILEFVVISLRHPESRSVNSQWDDNEKKYTGIHVNKKVETALLPGGEIYQIVHDRFGFKIKLRKSKKPLDPRIEEPGYIRYASINW